MRVFRRAAVYLSVAISIACSGSTPAAPSVAVPPPITTTPQPPPISTLDPLLSDPRFDLRFYRQFVLNGYERPDALEPLRRQTTAPRIYLRTIDDSGAAIDEPTISQTSAALVSVAQRLTGSLGLAGIERGIDSRQGQPGWITVRWSAQTTSTCGTAAIGGDALILYPRSGGCRCSGGPAVKPLIVKHELGHALGFRHTDSVTDLMHAGGHTACDMDPSAREQFHALVAYSRPIGSLDP